MTAFTGRSGPIPSYNCPGCSPLIGSPNSVGSYSDDQGRWVLACGDRSERDLRLLFRAHKLVSTGAGGSEGVGLTFVTLGDYDRTMQKDLPMPEWTIGRRFRMGAAPAVPYALTV